MADEPHAAVKLLVARMESHPEEFRIGDGVFNLRWSHQIDMVHDHGSAADKATLNAKLRDIIMGEVHEQVMEELLNGEDRRRKEEEEREYERHLAQSLQQSPYAQANQVLNQYSQYQQSNNQLNGLVGAAPNITGMKSNSITIDDQVLDASMIKRMKRMMLGKGK